MCADDKNSSHMTNIEKVSIVNFQNSKRTFTSSAVSLEYSTLKKSCGRINLSEGLKLSSTCWRYPVIPLRVEAVVS